MSEFGPTNEDLNWLTDLESKNPEFREYLVAILISSLLDKMANHVSRETLNETENYAITFTEPAQVVKYAEGKGFPFDSNEIADVKKKVIKNMVMDKEEEEEL